MTRGIVNPAPCGRPAVCHTACDRRVLSKSLDNVVPYVHVAKIDVEGAEIEVLRGMERLLAHEPKIDPRGRVESYVPTAGWPPPDELIMLLREVGYSPAMLSAEPHANHR
jgi:hypothetical protein